MLNESRVIPILLAPDLEASKRFYVDQLGLTVESETEDSVTFWCGFGTALRLSKSEERTKDSQTQLDFVVDDVRSEVAALRRNGVQFEEYDSDELTTVDGVADQGDAYVAWMTDPGGNVVGLEQPK